MSILRYTNLILFGKIWTPLAITATLMTWFLGHNSPKLNRKGQLFIWTVIRESTVAATVCLPISIIEMNTPNFTPDNFMIITIVTAIRYIIFSTIPWMICFSTLHFGVSIHYSRVILEFIFTFVIAVVLAVSRVVAKKPGAELTLTVMYVVWSTVLPIGVILINRCTRWKVQTSSQRTSTAIFDSFCLTILWGLLTATFLTADTLKVLVLLDSQSNVRIFHSNPFSSEDDIKERLKMVETLSVFAKYIFIGFFPLAALSSPNYRKTLLLELQKRKEFLGKILIVRDIRQRTSVVSVASSNFSENGRPSRCFSVVINNHQQCQCTGLGEQITDACIGIPNNTNSIERKKVSQVIDMDAIRMNLMIDLHQLHTSYDASCNKCVVDRARKQYKKKKPKLRMTDVMKREGYYIKK